MKPLYHFDKEGYLGLIIYFKDNIIEDLRVFYKNGKECFYKGWRVIYAKDSPTTQIMVITPQDREGYFSYVEGLPKNLDPSNFEYHVKRENL